MFEDMTQEQAKEQILQAVAEYSGRFLAQKKPYREGDRISYAGRVFDSEELVNLVDSSLEFWLTAGRYTEEFERGLADYLGVRYCSLVNSGSSANLLAFQALTSPELGDRRIRKGDEVITAAAGFPTTIAPIIQYGAVPVFVDVEIPQYNIQPDRLESALSEKTRAVFLAHTLGNPFDLQRVKDFCDKHALWLIEDNCDALGSEYRMAGVWKKTGTIGHIGTSSFYPPHHMTMGEGGAVYTNDARLHKIIHSFRDWGRDCSCRPGEDGRCGCRYSRQYGELPLGYDHKYVYSHFGYNLKATDMQAAIGCAQLKKLDAFTARRRKNFAYLQEGLQDTERYLILPKPAADARPSWFGFAITVKEEAPFTRDELAVYLEGANIQTRNLFAGNIIRHPCFDEMRKSRSGYRVAGDLKHTDRILNQTLWIGVYPGMDEGRLSYMIQAIRQFIQKTVK